MIPRILVVEDNPITRKLIRVTLTTAGYDVLEAPDGRTALELTASGRPALVLLDLLLPDMHGFDLVPQIRALPEGRDVPLIAVSGLIDQREDTRVMGLGFTDLLSKPVEPSRLIQTIGAYLPLTPDLEESGRGWRVLVADDEAVQRKLLVLQLNQMGFEVLAAGDGVTALDEVRRFRPHVVVSDVLMPGLDGFKLCEAIRGDPELGRTAVILTSSSYVDHEDECLAKRLGASRFIVRGPGNKETIETVLSCVRGRLPLPDQAPVTDADRGDDYVYRLVRQLERQAQANRSLAQRCSRQASELAVLGGVSAVLATTQELDPVLREILARSADTGGILRAAVYLRDAAGSLRLRADLNFQEADRPDLEEFFGHLAILVGTLSAGSAVNVTAATASEAFARDVLRRLDVGRVFLAPITTPGVSLGVVVFMVKLDRRSEEVSLDFARIVATQIGQVVSLAGAVSRLGASEERFRQLAEHIREVFWMIDRDSGDLLYLSPAYEAVWGRPRGNLSETAQGWFEAIHPDDRERVRRAVTQDQVRGAYDEEYRIIRPDGSIRWIRDRAFPIVDRAGRVYRIAGLAADVTEQKLQAATLEYHALYDRLTDLPNRALLHDRLRRAVSAATQDRAGGALLLFDLDRFREINDTLGHDRGDVLLRQIGPRIRDALRNADTVARLGGDEFAVLLPGAGPEDAGAAAAKIHAALEPPFVIADLPIHVEASIGIVLFPRHGSSADNLIQCADIAMYAAKRSGDGSAVYAPEVDRYNPRRLSLMAELRDAVQNDRLFLLYQPKIRLRTGEVAGVEALVRWRHPQHGVIPPDDFIAPAEQTGLIKPLTQWILQAGARQAQRWRTAGVNLSVAVNLSARSLRDPELPDLIAALVQAHHLPAGGLHLEITEGTVMADAIHAREIMTRLKALGVCFAIDDFGMGYSSLAYLKRLPLDELKIDKSFILNMANDANDASIVRSTIELAHNLGLTVVAEGVETAENLETLSGWGCDVVQGYHISRPLSADDLTRWLTESSWGAGRRAAA